MALRLRPRRSFGGSGHCTNVAPEDVHDARKNGVFVPPTAKASHDYAALKAPSRFAISSAHVRRTIDFRRR